MTRTTARGQGGSAAPSSIVPVRRCSRLGAGVLHDNGAKVHRKFGKRLGRTVLKSLAEFGRTKELLWIRAQTFLIVDAAPVLFFYEDGCCETTNPEYQEPFNSHVRSQRSRRLPPGEDTCGVIVESPEQEMWLS